MISNAENISFQERMKNQRIKHKKVFIIKLVCIMSTFLLLCVYFLIPFSHVSNTKVHGTKFYTTDQIIELAGLNKRDSLYNISGNDIEEKLNGNPLLGGKAKATITPFGMWIDVNELYPTAMYKTETKTTYYFNDFYTLENGEETNVISDALFASENVYIGEFLNSNKSNCVEFKFDPNDSSKIKKSNYRNIVSVLDKLSIEQKVLLKFVDYDKETNKVLMFLEKDEGTLFQFNVSLNSTNVLDGVSYLFRLNLDSLDLSKKTSKEKYTKQVYSWNVDIVETTHSYEVRLTDTKEN